MRTNGPKNAIESSNPNRIVHWDGDGMLWRSDVSERDMTSMLPLKDIADSLKRANEIAGVQIAGQPHSARTSSRTK
jgi:hypothetical protein